MHHTPLQGLPQEELQVLYQQAYEQAAVEQQQEVEAQAGGALDSLPQAVRMQLLQLKVGSGGRLGCCWPAARPCAM